MPAAWPRACSKRQRQRHKRHKRQWRCDALVHRVPCAHFTHVSCAPGPRFRFNTQQVRALRAKADLARASLAEEAGSRQDWETGEKRRKEKRTREERRLARHALASAGKLRRLVLFVLYPENHVQL